MKRFTETTKWQKPWYRKLPPLMKCVWDYVCDNCDMAGIWDADMELAEFQIGSEVNWDEIINAFGDRIKVLNDGKWWILGFIDFQYGELSEACKPHMAVINTLKKRSLWEAYAKGMDTLKDKDKEKDKEGGVGETRRGFQKPTLEQVTEHGVKIALPEAECVKFHAYYESNGWRVGKNPMKSWQAAMVNWRMNFGQRPGAVQAKSGGVIVKSVFDAKTTAEECQKEMNRLQNDSSNFTYQSLDGQMPRNVMKPEALAKLKQLKASLEAARQQLTAAA